MGWKQLAITWSHKGVKRSVDELSTLLKMIIREERKLVPTNDPAMEMPTREELPILGSATRQLMESNNTAKIDEEKFKKDAEKLQKQREARGGRQYFFCNVATLLSGAG